VLDDTVPEQRRLGIAAGLCWHARADASVVYTDLGISDGMKQGIASAKFYGLKVIYRQLRGTPYASQDADTCRHALPV
jgi:hypothetical protein